MSNAKEVLTFFRVDGSIAAAYGIAFDTSSDAATKRGNTLKVHLERNSGDYIDMSNIKMAATRFSAKQADMSNAELIACNITEARKANFSGANLTASRIRNCHYSDFRGANLTGATLTGDCDNIDLRGAKIIGAIVTDAAGLIDLGYIKGDRVIINTRGETFWFNVHRVTGESLYTTRESLVNWLAIMANKAYATEFLDAWQRALPALTSASEDAAKRHAETMLQMRVEAMDTTTRDIPVARAPEVATRVVVDD